ncbi:MAG: AsmA family protein, partial [Gammaproteobacteria bacterium]|nr:AsmA family protein [Gammaproteobacteria bacterium]
MGKLIKIILSLVGVVILLVVALAIALPFLVDPNDYKDKIATLVEEKTGRALTIEGDIGLSVFPWLGLDIGPTRLGNAEGFGEQPMASMENVQVRVKLVPLLSKQLEMDTVKLDGLRLRLARDASGRTNWQDLQGEPAEAEEAEAPPGTELAGLAIGGVQVTDAEVLWEDKAAGTSYVIDELAFSTGAIEPGEAFDLDLQFLVESSEPVMAGRFDLQGDVKIASSLKAVDISGTRLVLDLKGDAIPGGQMELTLATDIALDLEAQTLNMPQLIVETLGLKLTGNAAGTAISGDDPRFKGALAIDEFVPRELIKALGQAVPETADGTVLGKAGASLSWEASTRHAAATSLKFQLDDTTLNGSVRIDEFSKPAIGFKLQADQIDLDRYLPPPSEDAEAVAATPAAAAAGGAGALPVDTLRGLNLSGTLKLASLKAYNLRSTDIELTVKANNGLLRINPAGAKMYGGQYRGDITVDARKDTPVLSLDEKVSGVQAGPLLKDLTGDDKLLGTADFQAKLNGRGASPDQLRQTLNGTASFAFTNGAVKGVNIASLIRNAQAKLKGQPAPSDDLPNQTDFAELRGSATVTNGVVKNNDLSLQSPLLRVTGAGEASLPEETIDYLLTTKIVGSIEGQGGKGLGELKGVAIPVRIGGTFSKPSYTPDV